MNLYEINENIQKAFLECLDPETGEIVGDTSALDALTLERDVKVENIALFIKNLKAEADAIKAEEQKLTARRRTAENRAEWLKKYLAANLSGEAYKSPRVAISWRKSTSVEVTDLAAIPEEYLKLTIEPRKADIKAAIKAGETIEGVQIVEGTNMIIK